MADSTLPVTFASLAGPPQLQPKVPWPVGKHVRQQRPDMYTGLELTDGCHALG